MRTFFPLQVVAARSLLRSSLFRSFHSLSPSSSLCSSRTFSSPAPSTEDLPTKRARLLYQSKKRGILENDILLGEFAEKHLGTMEEFALEEYDKMINGEHMEWDLFYYLSGKKPAPEDVRNTTVYPMLKTFVDAKKVPSSTS